MRQQVAENKRAAERIRALELLDFCEEFGEVLRGVAPHGYVPLRTSTSMGKAVERAFRENDGSGMSLVQVVTNFLKFLADRVPKLATPNDEERVEVADEAARYLAAVDAIQTRSHIGREAVHALAGEAASKEERKSFVANVRLINGATRAETRHRLMLAFNTPFYPEILIVSSVMAEGVDLHMNCRYVIHHDMSWNPSSIEQRTGRVDRIGAKAEVAKKPIHVFLPFVAETQDERMFRVVRDRESWFQVVMGSEQAAASLSSAEASERIASRLPLPKRALNDLKLRLGLPELENGELRGRRAPDSRRRGIEPGIPEDLKT